MAETGVLGFATLLLGVATGTQQIDLMVSQPVAEVRVRLDRGEVALLDGPPWRFTLDLGPAPVPHCLEAIGRNAEGEEAGRAVQWINLPRPEAELDLIVERDDAGRPIAARLAWASPRPVPPTAVLATLDGTPVSVAADGRVALPALGRTTTHLLRVDVEFVGGKSASKEIAFGGVYADDSATALTAIPVAVARKRYALGAADVTAKGAAGERVRVVAVEEIRARLVAVVDGRGMAELRTVTGTAARGAAAAGVSSPRDRWCDWLRGRLKEGEDALCVVDPRPERLSDAARRYWLFTAEEIARLRPRDFVPALVRGGFGAWQADDQALANAVANGGLVAAAGGRRRAVLLVLGGIGRDRSTLPEEHARAFLRTLGVPLHVWSPDENTAFASDSPWGPITDVSTCARLESATGSLLRQLERQRIVWLEGEHLPQDVTLACAAARRLE